MPKKSKKSKSKRLTLRQKYKIKRKVREHARKQRKEENKARASGVKKKAPKDPGLPSQWPYKEELVKEFTFLRAQALAEEKRKKEERKTTAQARDSKAMDMEDGPQQLVDLAKLQASASHKQADFETRKRARLTEEFSGDHDNSRKAFYREFKRVVEASDVIIQVLDARDPVACRCLDVERYIRQSNPNKKIILLLNKMDLVPREVGERWLKYFREELPCVAFKCSTQQQGSGLAHKRGAAAKAGQAEDGFQSSACLGAETLLQLLKNYSRNSGIKTAITVGVVGLPNVGKSSLINSLKRARVAQVGNTPGVTKSVQEVVLDKHVKLLDSPGVVFASAESEAAAALRNAIKVERLSDPLPPVGEILKRVPAKKLMALYKIQAFSGPEEFLQHIAHARGKLRKGGTPDMGAAARIVLQDWNDGKIPYFTTPPERPKTGLEEAQVVAAWSAEFDAEAVFAAERSAVIAHLPSLNDDKAPDFFEAQTVGEAKADLAAMEDSDEGSSSDGDAGPSGMEADDDEDGLLAAAAAALQRREAAKASVAAGQNAALYNEDGQFNPHAARAQRKRQKRVRLSGGEEDGLGPGTSGRSAKAALGPQGKKPHPYGGDSDDDDADFDFAEANKGDGMDGSEGDDDDEGSEGDEGESGDEGEGSEDEEDEEDGGMED